MWGLFFGPPRIRSRDDGWVEVRLLGRPFEAPDVDALFRSVSRERDYLLRASTKLADEGRNGAALSMGRFGIGELHLKEMQRLNDRINVYTSFLGHLAGILDGERRCA